MSDHHPKNRDRLLANLSDDWESGTPAEAARAAARSIRRRRSARRASILASGLIAVGVLFATFSRTHPAAITKDASREPTLEIISDAELLALLQDQPVLAVRDARGISSVVWLDERSAPPAEN